jgi:hypothetical protein
MNILEIESRLPTSNYLLEEGKKASKQAFRSVNVLEIERN